MSPALREFYAVIAPTWHGPAGTARVQKGCSNAKSLQEKAKATQDADLVAATGALDAACAKDERRDVESKLQVVHDRFHVLAEPKH